MDRRNAPTPDTPSGILAGGLLGTALMTALMEWAQARRVTRISLPYLLGAMLTERRFQARDAPGAGRGIAPRRHGPVAAGPACGGERSRPWIYHPLLLALE
ncbi:MAG TPA: hypothetical protein VFV02_15155 [Acidimicrobiales bacterium]|nr:hypothetical protein [Acidimicrobiales bacterium]